MTHQHHTRRGDSLIPSAAHLTTSRTEAETPVTRPTNAEPRVRTGSKVWSTRDQHRQLYAIVGDILSEQPSPNTVRSAGRRINATVTQMADEIAQRVADQ